MGFTSDLSSNRRTFLKSLGALGLAAATRRRAGAAGTSVTDVQSGTLKNRMPLAANAFYPLALGSIRPVGWLRNQLQIQANGLGGHLDETWADVGPNSGWLGGSGESWERGPYFLDGLIPLAWLLDDSRLKAKAQRYVDWVLTHQAADGMIGPASNNDWWPRFVILKALTQYQELSGDARVIPLMDRYFRYQLSELPRRPLRDWGKFRWQDQVLTVLWLYNRTGAKYLVELARLLHAQGFDWERQFANFQYKQRISREYLKLEEEGNGLKDLALSTHGVNNAQAIKTGAVWSVLSGAESDRMGTAQMIAELDRYHGLPNGMFSCDEHLAGNDPSQGSELCSVVEYMFSLEQALAITGDAALGDRLERLAFNALPGTFSDDMWAHQYNQEPNQVECSLHTKPWTTDGPESNLYGLEPNFGCCTANFHQGWPKFANSLWMLSGSQDSDAEDGLAAVAYAPCEVEATVRGVKIRIAEETEYPFRGSVRLRIDPAAATPFPVALRVPVWAKGTSIKVNGAAEAESAAGSFAKIERTWKAGDRVEIEFQMEPRVSRWFHNSAVLERGPLVFSHGIKESWVKLRDRGMTADWQVFPESQWNYGLRLDKGVPGYGVKVEEHPVGAAVFSAKGAPVTLSVKASKLPEWRAEDGVALPVPEKIEAEKELEEITLVPYAAAKLRITAFPEILG